MNLDQELNYRLSIGCDFICKNIDLFNTTEKLQSISLLLSSYNILKRKSIKNVAKQTLTDIEKKLFEEDKNIFLLEDGVSFTYNNIVLASIYSKLDHEYRFKLFETIKKSETDNSFSIHYPKSKEMSFHLLPMVSLLNIFINLKFHNGEHENLGYSYYLADIYQSYKIDITHEISYAVWMYSILGEIEQNDSYKEASDKIIKLLSQRIIAGMSSLYASVYQQCLCYKNITRANKNDETRMILTRQDERLRLLNHQVSFQIINGPDIGAFKQRKNKEISIKSTIQNLWSFIFYINYLNNTQNESFF